MSKGKLTYKKFKNYFSNNLPNKDKHDFEKQMMQDAFEEEAFDGLSELNKDELEKDILELKSNISQRVKNTRKIIPVWFKYAASVIILIGIGTSIFLFNHRIFKDSMLKEQIANEMEIADSIMLESEKEIKQFAEKIDSESFRKNTSADVVGDFIADNRKKEIKKTFELVEDYKVIETDKTISEAEVIDLDEEVDDNVELSDIEEDLVEVLDDEEIIVENIDTEKTEQALQGAVQEIVIRGVSSVSKSSKKYNVQPSVSSISEEKIKARVIKGKVLATNDDLSIPGVSIIVKDNPNIGTTTNIDGEFSLTIPDSDEELKTLIAQFIGMETQEISILEDTNILVYMEPNMLEMDEVIVTAYGVSSESQDYYEIEKTEAKPSDLIGLSKYKKQIIKSLDYSKFADFPGKNKIKFSFIVDINGDLSNFDFVKSPDFAFNDEIIRVMKEAGNWIPAQENNHNVRSTVKITFKIVVK